MGIGRETLEVVAQALMHHLVHGEPPAETLHLGVGGQPAPDDQPSSFYESAVLGQLLDRDATVAQNTFVAVDVGDGGLAGTGVTVPVVQGNVAGAVAQRANVDPEFVFGPFDNRKIMGLSIQFDATRMAHNLGSVWS